jgi:hypothetical protein
MRAFGRSLHTTMKWLAAASSLAALLGVTAPAQAAVEVTCVEASRYKYLYQIFDNDPGRFAAHFGVNQSQLPSPDACSAVVIAGTFEAPERGTENDVDRLIAAIQQGRGWLSTVYLASPGGKGSTAVRLAALTRMFWLNTVTVDNGAFDYVPDFLGGEGPGSAAVVPPALKRGLANYMAATQSISKLEMDSSSLRCSSTCAYIHAAGIYRAGMAYFQRGHRSDAADTERVPRPEGRPLAFYRAMDVGDDAIQAFQQAISGKTISSDMRMAPQDVGDALKRECGGTRRTFPTTAADLKCVAGSNARKRLAQYAKLCQDGCSHRELISDTGRFIRSLVPRDGGERQSAVMQRGTAR